MLPLASCFLSQMRVKLSRISATKTLAALKRLLAEILLRKASCSSVYLSLNEQNEENRQENIRKKCPALISLLIYCSIAFLPVAEVLINAKIAFEAI